MKGRISPLFRKILSNDKTRKQLQEIVYSKEREGYIIIDNCKILVKKVGK